MYVRRGDEGEQNSFSRRELLRAVHLICHTGPPPLFVILRHNLAYPPLPPTCMTRYMNMLFHQANNFQTSFQMGRGTFNHSRMVKSITI